jgi:hypothetical protein
MAWAIWRGREFIGTIPYISNETTKEFELRPMAWFAEPWRTELNRALTR